MAVRYPPVTITHTVARGGHSPGDVSWPHSVSMNHTRGHIIITDGGTHRVNTYSSEYPHRPIRSWGRRGHREGEFACPRGVTSDHQGRVIVCDGNNLRLQIFTDTGDYVTQIRCGLNEEGEEILPRWVEVDDEDNIYVCGDSVGDDMIHVYDRVGVPVRRFPVMGLWGPFTIHEDTLYMCDDYTRQIHVHTLPHGAHVTSIPLEGVMHYGVCDITVSRDGRLIVTERYDGNNKSLIHVLSVSDSGEVSGASQTFTYDGQADRVSILWDKTLVIIDVGNRIVRTVTLPGEVVPPVMPYRASQFYEPRSLRDQSRATIRQILHGLGRLTPEHVEALVLPDPLPDYLMFKFRFRAVD